MDFTPTVQSSTLPLRPMPLVEFTALLVLATAMSFTPGPNTTLSTALAANGGLPAAMRFVLSVPVGWSALLLLCAGGLGALVLALRNPDEYVSVSAFSPIVSPSQVPWGQQAFAAYLGENKDAWLDYDPVSLISQGQRVAEIMVDQGLSDDFYAEQLRTPNLEKICQEMNIKTLIRYHEGYDHSYYFVSSFIGEHIAYHANKLNMR